MLDYFPWVLGATVLCLLALASTLITKFPNSVWEEWALRLIVFSIAITVMLEVYLIL